MMTKEELKKLDATALHSEAKALKKEFFNLKLGLISGQVKDTSQFRKLRVSIAQMLTLAKQKELAAKQQNSAQ
jgi:ribosomal protein L29